jgi:hypothetical protein
MQRHGQQRAGASMGEGFLRTCQMNTSRFCVALVVSIALLGACTPPPQDLEAPPLRCPSVMPPTADVYLAALAGCQAWIGDPDVCHRRATAATAIAEHCR